jgi:hypothetical protein
MGKEWAFQGNTDRLMDAKAKNYQAFCEIRIGEWEQWLSRVIEELALRRVLHNCIGLGCVH